MDCCTRCMSRPSLERASVPPSMFAFRTRLLWRIWIGRWSGCGSILRRCKVDVLTSCQDLYSRLENAQFLRAVILSEAKDPLAWRTRGQQVLCFAQDDSSVFP